MAEGKVETVSEEEAAGSLRLARQQFELPVPAALQIGMPVVSGVDFSTGGGKLHGRYIVGDNQICGPVDFEFGNFAPGTHLQATNMGGSGSHHLIEFTDVQSLLAPDDEISCLIAKGIESLDVEGVPYVQLGDGQMTIDGEFPISALGAAVSAALAEAGYEIVKKTTTGPSETRA